MKEEKLKKDTANEAEEKEARVRQTGSLKERLSRVKKTRWIRFGIVSVIFFALATGGLLWLGSYSPIYT